MKKNNRGFSLVEFIVAFAIAAIAGLAAFEMMSFGNNSFRNTSTDVGLQYEQQIVVNQLRDFILESSNAIHYDDTTKSLYVFKQTTNTITTESGTKMDAPYMVSRISFNDPNAGLSEGDSGYNADNVGELYVNTKDFSSITDDYVTALADIGKKFGSDVKEVTYDLSQVEKGQVSFDITFLSKGKEYYSHQIVSLRNNIVNADDLKDIYDTTRMEVNSFIEGVSIYKDGIRLGATDEILRPTNETSNEFVMKAYYSAKVEKNQYSEFDYPGGVTWELDSSYANVTGSEEGENFVISVTGIINGTVKLTATSIADPTVKKELTITVKSTGGVYPKTAEIKESATTVMNNDGTRTYTLLPKITYTGMVGSSTYVEGVDALELVDWCVDEATKADLLEVSGGYVENIDPATGQISFNSKANGHTFYFTIKVKQRKADGTVLESERYALKVDGIPETYTTPFKVNLNSVSLRDDYVRPSVGWTGTQNQDIYYYWKVVPTKDNKSAQWNSSELGRLATDFDDIVRVYENKGSARYVWSQAANANLILYDGAVAMDSSNKWISKISLNSDIYAGITDWYSTGLEDKWFVSKDANMGPIIYIQSYLNWNYQFQYKVLCFAVTEDGSKLYDFNGEHDLRNISSITVTPIEATSTIKEVVLRLQAVSSTAVSDATKKANYKTDSILVPGTEERYFRYTAQGLNITFMGASMNVNDSEIRGGYSLRVDAKGRDFKPNYVFKSLAGQTLTMGNDLKIDSSYYESNGVVGFTFNFNKNLTSVNNLKPEIMEYSITLTQKYEKPLDSKVFIENKVESEKVKYSVDINYNSN